MALSPVPRLAIALALAACSDPEGVLEPAPRSPSPTAEPAPPEPEPGAEELPEAPPPRATRVVVSHAASCALLEGGAVRCVSKRGTHEVARDVIDLALSGDELCVLERGGDVRCGHLADPIVLARARVQAAALLTNRCVSHATRGVVCNTRWAGSSFEAVDGPTGGVRGVASGPRVCVVDEAREVWCWRSDDHRRRARRIDAARGARDIALAEATLFFVDEQGALRSMADRGRGFTGRASPVPLSGPARAVRAGGTERVCAVLESGEVECPGRLALDPEGASALRGALSVDVAFTHACAVRADGEVVCWGQNTYGAMGPSASSWVRPAPTGFTGATAVVRFRGMLCASAPEETACWGGARPREPAPLAGLAGSDTWLGASCALSHGEVWCWRSDSLRGRPARVEGLPDDLEELAAETRIQCARANGTAYCWGESGGFSYEDDGDHEEPLVRVAPREMPWRAVRDLALRVSEVCALHEEGASCLSNSELTSGGAGEAFPELAEARVMAATIYWVCGALPGRVRCVHRSTARRVVELPVDARALAADQGDPSRLCAATTDGHVECATLHDEGEASIARVEGIDGAVDVAVRAESPVCALREGGEVWCWGEGTHLGREPAGAFAESPSPRELFAR